MKTQEIVTVDRLKRRLDLIEVEFKARREEIEWAVNVLQQPPDNEGGESVETNQRTEATQREIGIAQNTQPVVVDYHRGSRSVPPLAKIEKPTRQPPKRRNSPEGSRRMELRKAIANLPEPFTAAAAAVKSGMSKKFVAAAMSTFLADGELESDGKEDGLKTYRRAASWSVNAAKPIVRESEYCRIGANEDGG